jgi:tetratricopeptide (TPR) repeat protein
MQRQIDTLARSLAEFIEQPDYPTLILNGTDPALVLPTRILAARDRQDDGHYYLLFVEPCGSAAQYLAGIIDSLKKQIDVFNAELRARQLPPWPALPLEAEDSRHPPSHRLEAVVRYMGRQLPGSSPIVWGLLPGELADMAGYAELVRPLLVPVAVPPWMDRHRFLLRDRGPDAAIVPALLAAKNDRVLVLDVELDSARVTSSLAETAQDRTLSPDERMLAFYQLAAIDFSYQRYPDALEKYGAMFNYYSGSGNKPMQALCLTGAADVHLALDQPDRALERYQQSLAISVDDANLPALHAGTYGAGVSCLALDRDAEAEGYLAHANDLAGKLHNPYAKCDAMEKLGVARFRQGKVQDAVDIWLKGKDLAKQFGYDERAKSVLEHLVVACRNAGLVKQEHELARERESLDSQPPHDADNPEISARQPEVADA